MKTPAGLPPCVLFEDEHLLAVNKPAGLNTHSPGPWAGEGVYDWLRHREPRWSRLALIHRLDKETSGVIVFSKTPEANRSLVQQFTERTVRKRYLLLTDIAPARLPRSIRNALVRTGHEYIGRPLHAGAPVAETRFLPLDPAKSELLLPGAQSATKRFYSLVAEPLTGRTHQVRSHAAEAGFPVLGDPLYGGTPWPRLCLHSFSLALKHPATGYELVISAPADFSSEARLALRTALLDFHETNACRLVHGASDGSTGWFVDRLGSYLLAQQDGEMVPHQRAELMRLAEASGALGCYHKRLAREVSRVAGEERGAQLVSGEAAPARFNVLENGLRFELSFAEGYSVGLFLDQRDNRRRLLSRYIEEGFAWPEPRSAGAKLELLNTFAYTCGFSVCAASAGMRATSLDLSKHYLEWGKRNFELNGLHPGEHDFIFGDTFDWLQRFAKKERRFDLVLLDPPTFSQSRQSGVFRAKKDYPKLLRAALGVLNPGGLLFASTNARDWEPERFVEMVQRSVGDAGRKLRKLMYCPQPPDFPISREQPAHLKTVWASVA